MIINMTMNDPERYYCMPLRGITETRVRVGLVTHTQYTARCASRSCWFVGHAGNSGDAQRLLDEHTCPQPPARNELPSGYSTVEKMWDELDDVTRAIMAGEPYASGDRVYQEGTLRGYASGLAFALAMMSHPHFRTTTEIAREAQRRYKMWKNELPYEPTPGYRYNPVTPRESPEGEKAPFHGDTKPAAARAPAKKAAKKAAPVINFGGMSNDDRKRAIQAFRVGMFNEEELAKMYKVSIETIRYMVNN